jgi:hypothetical protein
MENSILNFIEDFLKMSKKIYLYKALLPTKCDVLYGMCIL